MSISRIAANYADALLSASKDAAKSVAQLGEVAEAYAASSDFRAVLGAPVVSPDQKIKAVQILCEKWGTDATVSAVLSKLVKNDRATLLPAVYQAALSIQDKQTGRTHVVVETPRQWPDADKDKFVAGLALGETRVDWVVRSDLVGGARVRVGDQVWDGSVRKQLAQIENLLTR